MTTNRATRRARARVAKRPPARTLEVELDDGGPFDGWYVKARADFPARLLEDLESGTAGRVLSVMSAIVLEHNMPGDDGELAATMADVAPYDGLLTMAGRVFEAIGRLPNR